MIDILLPVYARECAHSRIQMYYNNNNNNNVRNAIAIHLYGGGNSYLHRYGRNYHNKFYVLYTHSYTFDFFFFVSVIDKPQFKNRPRNVQADSGSHVSIACDVDSNPPASIEWTFEKTKKVSAILLFIHPSPFDVVV